MIVQDLPLLELFIRLQKAGLPLGIEEYQPVLYALQAGFGLSGRAALKCLCCTLWVKSADEKLLFDYHFERLMTRLVESEPSSQPVEEALPTQIEASPTSPSIPSETVIISEMVINVEDKVQVAQAVQATTTYYESPSTHYIASDKYFPVTRRQMKQSWRYLRRPMREGPPVELDVEATINEIGRKGILLEPVLVPSRINRAELLLLIDHGGSMVPFYMLSHQLVETVLRSGRLGHVGIYYFHNCPTEYLYYDVAYQEYKQIGEILDGRYSQWTGVLVFSDAGAARGSFSRERIDLTEKFLERFKRRFRYIAWLNPMPRERWSGTAANEVMQSVPMFDLSRRGLDDAISVLRGQLSQDGYSLRRKYHA